MILQRFLLRRKLRGNTGGAGIAPVRGGILERCPVARVRDRADDVLRRCGPFHAHGVREQAYRAARHAFDLAHGLLDPGLTRRAAHACYCVLFH